MEKFVTNRGKPEIKYDGFHFCIERKQKVDRCGDMYFILYNDFIVNIYIQLDWEQVFTTY